MRIETKRLLLRPWRDTDKLDRRPNPDEDFDDATVPEGDALRPHVLYRITKPVGWV